MVHHPVNSSRIASVAYDEKSATLEIRFRDPEYSNGVSATYKDRCGFPRLSLALLALLGCIWIALIFDFGGVMGHLSEWLNALDQN